ncbi:MAG: hypothetical protein BWY82_00955 [Verrucomicrobia bacterium ADurb.Bin474]|nr:MAG: hypothetical protein BWY82_00955 [Verrucomicrobia bacterium ADurb.Bin474]
MGFSIPKAFYRWQVWKGRHKNRPRPFKARAPRKTNTRHSRKRSASRSQSSAAKRFRQNADSKLFWPVIALTGIAASGTIWLLFEIIMAARLVEKLP